ncbi:gamma-glutamylcyclotransferase family protein [Nocardia gipuzkoensis]|uniref:gamma-glutamylcyclotransferase family protein n=1 Tax=Nocardia gipuzkoensis TaxID=2749991 RepID=UPI003EDEDAD3
MTDRSEILSNASSAALFAYGTLQIDAVLATLIGRIPPTTPAQLPGWRVVRLQGRPYPGLVRDDAHTAVGLLLTDLTPDEWRLLDRFEDPDYELEQVTVQTGAGAWVYAWPKEFEDLEWNLRAFEAEELPRYVTRCAAWLERDRNRV